LEIIEHMFAGTADENVRLNLELLEFLTQSGSAASASTRAVHGDVERGADLVHPVVAEPPKTLHKRPDGDALDGVEVHTGSPRDRIMSRFQHDLAGQAADRGRTGRDERAT
jgi:hypothetical protein